MTGEPGKPTPEFTTRLVRGAIDAPLLQAWRELCTRVAEPNPFYEPWALLPALEHLDDQRAALLLVECVEAGAARLVALVPVIERPALGGLMRIRQVWTHAECYLGTPLVDAACLTEASSSIALWLTDGAIGRIERSNAAGPVTLAVLDAAPELRLESTGLERYSRALCDTTTHADADAYLARSISHKHRKELRRQHNRLAELAGGASIEELTSGAELEAWVEEFLTLEAKGWKGAGAALRTKPAAEAFFRALCRNAWSEGRLHFLAMRSGSRAIAMKCNLLAPPGAFAIKICFDEDFGRYSPGTHMELDNVERLFGLRPRGILWMDSCASRRRWLVDRMWGERRSTETLLLARTQGFQAGMLHIMPLVIWVRRLFGAAH